MAPVTPASSIPPPTCRCGDTLYRRYGLALPALDDMGYHQFELEPADGGDRPVARLHLIGVADESGAKMPWRETLRRSHA